MDLEEGSVGSLIIEDIVIIDLHPFLDHLFNFITFKLEDMPFLQLDCFACINNYMILAISWLSYLISQLWLC